MLNDEGLAKPERQAKLASLFTRDETVRPVVVLDPGNLGEGTRKEYYRILEGPIKNAVTKARKQLRQTRLEYPQTTTSILFVINNGYTALNHDELLRLVAHRARNDSSEIDGVVVAGFYFYSDGFDNHFVWPIEYWRINSERSFPSFIKLRDAWNQCAEEFMTAVVRGELECDQRGNKPGRATKHHHAGDNRHGERDPSRRITRSEQQRRCGGNAARNPANGSTPADVERYRDHPGNGSVQRQSNQAKTENR